MTREQIIDNLESYKVNLKRIEYLKRKIKEFQPLTLYTLDPARDPALVHQKSMTLHFATR